MSDLSQSCGRRVQEGPSVQLLDPEDSRQRHLAIGPDPSHRYLHRQAENYRAPLGEQQSPTRNSSPSTNLRPVAISTASHSTRPAPMMEPSASSVVQIQPGFNKAFSPIFAHHSPALQLKLSSQSRISPIDASRFSNHPYTKTNAAMNTGSLSRRGSPSSTPLTPIDAELAPYRSAPLSGGLKDSPRRKRRPDFPTSPRSAVARGGDSYALDSPLDYTQTPSILRVPFTPAPLAMQFPSPTTRMDPRYRGPETSSLAGSALPVSNVRDTSPGNAVSSGSSRQAARSNALPRSRPRTESIPRSYVLKSLNNLAPHFWNRPATADCRIIIPIRNPGQLTPSPSTLAILNSPTVACSPRFQQVAQSSSSATARYSPPQSAADTFGASSPRIFLPPAGTASDPEHDKGQKILSFMLHRDYLVTQSTLFQKLLDPSHTFGNPELAKVPSTAPSTFSTFSDKENPHALTGMPDTAGNSVPPRSSPVRINGAKVLTTSTGTLTAIWLPLPDPNSFGALAHWLYWQVECKFLAYPFANHALTNRGDSSHLEEALARNHITWQGLIKNIEYLGLDNRIKRVLGSWWRRWVKVTPGRRESASGVAAATASQQRRKRSAASTHSQPVSDEEDDELPFEDPLVHANSRDDSPMPAQVDGLGIRNSVVSPVDTAEVAKMMDSLRPSDPV